MGNSGKVRILRILVVLIVLLAIPAVVGNFLPEHYEGRTQLRFGNPPDEVWAALQDYGSHPMTGRMMQSVEALPDVGGLPAWVEDMGRGGLITVTTVESERGIRMVREMASAEVPMTSRWEYVLTPDGDGCTVTIDGVTDIADGSWHVPFFRFMMTVGGGVKKGLDIQLEMVSETLRAEAGT